MAEQHVGARAVEVMAPNGLPACFGTKPRIARLAIDGPPIRRPMNNLDGWGTARKMIELYGKEAQCEARRRCEKAFQRDGIDRKSTRLNSSHLGISYAVFCLKN